MGDPRTVHGRPPEHPPTTYGRPKVARGLSVGCPWIAHGSPMGRPWVARGLSVRFLWGTRELSVWNPWVIRGALLDAHHNRDSTFCHMLFLTDGVLRPRNYPIWLDLSYVISIELRCYYHCSSESWERGGGCLLPLGQIPRTKLLRSPGYLANTFTASLSIILWCHAVTPYNDTSRVPNYSRLQLFT